MFSKFCVYREKRLLTFSPKSTEQSENSLNFHFLLRINPCYFRKNAVYHRNFTHGSSKAVREVFSFHTVF